MTTGLYRVRIWISSKEVEDGGESEVEDVGSSDVDSIGSDIGLFDF